MRKLRALNAPAIVCLACCGLIGESLNGQTIVEQNGIRYIQRTEPVEQPTTTVTWEERRETAYQERYRTEFVESQQTVLVPVTEYRWEPRVHNWWNPLIPNTIAYHMVPRTRWEPRQHTIRYPQNYRELVPVERTVHVPRRELGFETRQRQTLTALSPAASPAGTQVADSQPPPERPAASVARQPTYVGGVQQMSGDLPRYSTRPGGVTQYR